MATDFFYLPTFFFFKKDQLSVEEQEPGGIYQPRSRAGVSGLPGPVIFLGSLVKLPDQQRDLSGEANLVAEIRNGGSTASYAQNGMGDFYHYLAPGDRPSAL